jgi:hypothetical protein
MNTKNPLCAFALTLALLGGACGSNETNTADTPLRAPDVGPMLPFTPTGVGPMLPFTPTGVETLRQPAPQDMPGFNSPSVITPATFAPQNMPGFNSPAPTKPVPFVSESYGAGPGFNSPSSFSKQGTDVYVAQPAEPEGEANQYSFIYEEEHTRQSEAPYRWDPCTPIRYATNFELASPIQTASFYAAVEIVSAATGFTFVEAGSFLGGQNGFDDEIFEIENGLSVGEFDAFFGIYTRYDDDVLHGSMGVGNVRRGQSASETQEWIVHGYVAIQDDPWWQDDMELSRQVWLHELGHFVGLGHVADKDEIMSRSALESNPEYGPGDLTGLRAVGSEHGCRTSEQSQTSFFRKAALLAERVTNLRNVRR